MIRSIRIIPLLSFLLVLTTGMFVYLDITQSEHDWPRQAALAAKEVCEGKQDLEFCYQKTVSLHIPERSVPEVFEAIRELRRIDPKYQFCHTLAHKVAERLVAVDPEQWFDLVPLNPSDGLCSNGFIHGIIIGRFRNVTLDEAGLTTAMPGFKRACEPRPNWIPTPLDSGICYHGMGHLYTFITNADINKALELCEETSHTPSGNFKQVCYEGVFMQIFQPIEPDDFELISHLPYAVTKDNYRRFCAEYSGAEAQGACLREAWMLFRPEILSGDYIEPFCKNQPNEAETMKCKTTVYTILGRMLAGKMDRAQAACEKVVHKDDEAYCIGLVAQTIIEEDRNQGEEAIAFCERTAHPQYCLGHLASRARFVFGDTERYSAFCAATALKGYPCSENK